MKFLENQNNKRPLVMGRHHLKKNGITSTNFLTTYLNLQL